MLLDLSLVTEALTTLIAKYADQYPLKPKYAVPALVVSPQPPDQLKGEHAIGLYLYHVKENAALVNPPPVSPDEPPVRYSPLALNLSYLLTAHSDVEGAAGTFKEQLLLGVAMKALHDYSVIDDQTAFGGVPVFPADLQNNDNFFRIKLEPVEPPEVVTYWTAGSQPLRLAAYYTVQVALLQPDLPKTRTGRVLRFGVFTFVRGSPRLDLSKTKVTFTVPGEATPRTLDITPAEAPVGGSISFAGSDLAGDQTTLLVKNPRFPGAIEVAAQWGVIASEQEILATIGAVAGTFSVLPGAYTAAAKVVERRRMPDGSLRDFAKVSNEVAFTVTPAISALAFAVQTLTITGGVFQDPAIPADAVQVFIGPAAVPLEPSAVLTAGHFKVLNATTIRVLFPISGLTTGDVVPVRVLVNGAENAPRWVKVP